MLEIYAQEIVDLLSETLERSVVVTNIDGIIIGAPAKERIGTAHPPSIPVMKYGKMSFDDNEAARRMGVWYPGATVPIFFHGSVVGSVGIAGEPEVVSKFSLLVKKQVESILREKVLIESRSSSQGYLDELVKDIYCFDQSRDNPRLLFSRAEKVNIRLDIPRVVIAVAFSSFSELNPACNDLGLPYSNKQDPFFEELEYRSTQSNVVNVIRQTFSNSQDVVSTTARDKFVIMRAFQAMPVNMEECYEALDEQCEEIFTNLQKRSINTCVGIGSPAKNLYEIPVSYDNAVDVVNLAEKMQISPGIFRYDKMPLEQLLMALRPSRKHSFLWDRVAKARNTTGGDELIETFMAYCQSMFNKLHAAEKLFIHRNTLIYRLNKLEKLAGVDFSDFGQLISFYISCRAMLLNDADEAFSEQAIVFSPADSGSST
ncbi:helix-turn-helix domain-containing protein [Synergistaceae bacterium OttesenSCG-928-I11]|nr:helix-turn-helix domain-containing protein [Synergistaceae bacterium OttesenSCG-928-I11]